MRQRPITNASAALPAWSSIWTPLDALAREAGRAAASLAATQAQSARLAESLGSDAAAMAQAQHDIRQSLAHSTAALAQLQDALVEIAEAITTQLAATRP